jgi:hypothetical protein
VFGSIGGAHVCRVRYERRCTAWDVEEERGEETGEGVWRQTGQVRVRDKAGQEVHEGLDDGICLRGDQGGQVWKGIEGIIGG